MSMEYMPDPCNGQEDEGRYPSYPAGAGRAAGERVARQADPRPIERPIQMGVPREALPIENPLSSDAARVPQVIEHSSGIVLQGRRLRSFIYSTDVAIIRNTNADAILAVYPFTGHPVITQAILAVAQAPVFVGVGGGTTTGTRVIELAVFAEMQGVAGVVLNAPSPATTVRDVAMAVNIPVIVTVTAWNRSVVDKVEAGAGAINVAAGKDTAQVVYLIKQRYPEIPVLASSGKSDEAMAQTIAAGANALTWTPPSAQAMQGAMMDRYRSGQDGSAAGHHAGPSHGSAGAQPSATSSSADGVKVPKHKRQTATPEHGGNEELMPF